MLVANIEIGQKIRCDYPDSKSGVLTPREGVVEQVGNGPNGGFCKVHLGGEQYRSLSYSKITNLVLVAQPE